MNLASYHTHIDNGGFSIEIDEDEGCISIKTEYSYCEFSHSSSLFCGKTLTPKDLVTIGNLFMQAADTLEHKLADE